MAQLFDSCSSLIDLRYCSGAGFVVFTYQRAGGGGGPDVHTDWHRLAGIGCGASRAGLVVQRGWLGAHVGGLHGWQLGRAHVGGDGAIQLIARPWLVFRLVRARFCWRVFRSHTPRFACLITGVCFVACNTADRARSSE